MESAGTDSCRATQSAAGEYTVVISTVENRHQAWECFDSTAETQTNHAAIILLLSAADGVQKYAGIPSFQTHLTAISLTTISATTKEMRLRRN